jgi:RNA 2',3'-cyclic 3'-phosphodiesterase
VDGDERLRLFCGLRLPADRLEQVAHWQLRELPRGRIVPPENLHFTLVFLGSQAAADAPAIARALEDAAREASGLRFRLRGYRETRSVGMLTFDDEDSRGAALAGRLGSSLDSLGLYRPESRPWLPHLTVVRFRERPRLKPELPALGDVLPSDAAVFISRLRRDGAQYEVFEAVPLGG